LSVSDGEQEEGKHASNTRQSQPSNTARICLQSTSEFDASSRRYCAACCTDVKISFGGEANWDIHVKSAAHVRSGQAASQKASASRFFSNFITKAPSLPTATSSRSTNLSSTVSLDLSEVDYPEAMDAPILSPTIIDLVDDDRAETPALLDEPASLLMRLRSAQPSVSPCMSRRTRETHWRLVL